MDMERWLIVLRQKLVDARKSRDSRSLEELSMVFTLLEEIAIEERCHLDFIEVIIDLGYAARDQSIKTEWANIIPSEEKIKEAMKL